MRVEVGDARDGMMDLETLPPPIERRAARPKTRLSSVAMAIHLLKAFSEDQAEIGVSALAQRLGIAKSTVHRLAVTLVAEGMLEKNPETEKYRLGIALFHLGTLVRRRMDLPVEARPYLFELREKTHETVLLGIPSDADVMYVYHLESPQAIRMRSELGVRRPAFCTAVGRAILAFQPEDAIERSGAVGSRPQPGHDATFVSRSAKSARSSASSTAMLRPSIRSVRASASAHRSWSGPAVPASFE